jgi:hypothetical protein
MMVAIAPGLVILPRKIKMHYRYIGRQVGKAVALQIVKLQPLAVVIPINGWNRIVERAVRFGLMLSDDITAIHLCTEQDGRERLRILWEEKVVKPTRRAGAAGKKTTDGGTKINIVGTTTAIGMTMTTTPTTIKAA